MGGSRGGERGSGPPLKNHKNIGFLCNTGPDPLKNHKATKPAFNVGPASARQRNAISMAGRRWPIYSSIWILYTPINLRKKKLYQIWTPCPPLTKLSEYAHGIVVLILVLVFSYSP